MTDSKRNNVKTIRGMHSKEIAPIFASKASPVIIDRMIVTIAVAKIVNTFKFLLIFSLYILYHMVTLRFFVGLVKYKSRFRTDDDTICIISRTYTIPHLHYNAILILKLRCISRYRCVVYRSLCTVAIW